MSTSGVLLIDWENLSGAVLGRGMVVERALVDDIWSYAAEEFPGRLRAHIAATSFDPTIRSVTNERLIDRYEVRSTKEQADIALTVMAMDYLHRGVRDFILVTGDQDFVHLIERLLEDQARVTVIYGDRSRLSNVLRHTLNLPGVLSRDVDEIARLRRRQAESGGRSFVSLLELQRRGHILGGKVTDERIRLLSDWGIMHSQDETEFYALVKDLGEQTVRRDAAVVGRDRGSWEPRNATRTYLKITPERLKEIVGVDHLVRVLSSRQRGVSPRELRAGPFRDDGGQLLDKALDALVCVGIARKGPNDVYDLVGEAMPLGYLEQLWRIYAAISTTCFERSVSSFPFSQLEGLLRAGIGQGEDSRSSNRVKGSIRYSSAAGVIDKIAVGGKAHVVALATPLSRPIERAYRILYDGFASRLDQTVSKQDVHGFMEEHDLTRTVPDFGFDPRDRDRVLRVLRQSGLLGNDEQGLTIRRTKWGDAIMSTQ